MEIKNELYKYAQIFEIDTEKNLLTLYIHPEFISNINDISGLIKLEHVKYVIKEENGNI